jgi:hypothetical protein
MARTWVYRAAHFRAIVLPADIFCRQGAGGQEKDMTGGTDARALASRISGQVLAAGDDGYDDARAVWNAMVDRKPRLIARCTSAGDVATAIRYARERELEIGVRCGGHSVLGAALPDGLMIDLTPMRDVRVAPRAPRC